MNILVTGSEGFIGSHLTEMLVKRGYKVTAVVQYNSFNNWGWLDTLSIKKNIDIISGDIRDSNFCENVTKDKDIIFHLAALIAIPFSYIAPQSYVDTNIIGTLNMCQAAKKNNIKKFIHTSTSEVYGSAKYVPIDEKHPLQPQSPYSATKIGADSIAMSFFNSFDLPVTIVRPFNVYGPRQSARAIIPNTITQILSKKDAIFVGDISPTRDFTFVEDTCEGFIATSEKNNTEGLTLNLGSNFEVSIKEAINLIKKLMNSDIEVVQSEERFRPKKSEVQRLFCDNSLMGEIVGFKPKYNFEDGINKTIEWFSNKDNLTRYKTDIYNI